MAFVQKLVSMFLLIPFPPQPFAIRHRPRVLITLDYACRAAKVYNIVVLRLPRNEAVSKLSPTLLHIKAPQTIARSYQYGVITWR
jgi:hypothetical protein